MYLAVDTLIPKAGAALTISYFWRQTNYISLILSLNYVAFYL
jgi:hypothetical protein